MEGKAGVGQEEQSKLKTHEKPSRSLLLENVRKVVSK